MGATKIAWTEKTWNPVVGCSRVSAGCDNCYAARMAKRLAAMGNKDYWHLVNKHGHWTGTVRCLRERLEQPLHWRDPKMVFVCSMGDLFHRDVPDSFIASVFEVMCRCPQHTFQVLTKRTGRLRRVVNGTIGWPVNAWAGVTVEDKRVLGRICDLRETSDGVRFLSCEPLIGPLGHLPLDGIDWVIVGGETGPGARQCKVQWIRSIVDQCKAAGMAVFVKHLGGKTDWPGQVGGVRFVPPAHPGNWPADLRVREYPKTGA